MSKLDDIINDLATLDAMVSPNADKIFLQQRVRALEEEREKIDHELRNAVKRLDDEETKEDPAKKNASAFAVAIVSKYKKSIAELRAILSAIG